MHEICGSLRKVQAVAQRVTVKGQSLLAGSMNSKERTLLR